jgi:hypothetical protein
MVAPCFDRPTNFIPGYQERKTKFGELESIGIPPLRDVIEIIDKKDWGDIIRSENKPECTSRINAVYYQREGSCTNDSAYGGYMLLRGMQGLPLVMFNPLFTYWDASGGSDRGSSLDKVVSLMKTKGVCPEKAWPRSNGFRRPPEEAYEAAKDFTLDEVYDMDTSSRFVNEVGTSVLQGYPFHGWYDSHAIMFVEMILASQASPDEIRCADICDLHIQQMRRKRRLTGRSIEPVLREIDPSTDEFILRYLNSWGNWGSASPYGNIPYGLGTMRMGTIGVGGFAYRLVKWNEGTEFFLPQSYFDDCDYVSVFSNAV